MSKHYVILGGGIAGLTAAEELRSLQPQAAITLVCKEDLPPYSRPLLTKTLLKTIQKDRLLIHPESWYKEMGIDLLLGREAVCLDPENHKITLNDDSSLIYDKLIYALGAEPFMPKAEGMDAQGIFGLRTAEDVYRIHRFAAIANQILVIGAGVIGMEAAWELKQLCPCVQMIEAAPRLMSRQLDQEAADLMAEKLKATGIGLKTGVLAVSFTKNESGRVTGAVLSDGTTISADLVVVSAGTVPNTALAKAAGLACGRGLLVNETMQTSDPDIFAAGDCIEGPDLNPQLWTYAAKTAKIAARSAAGESPKAEEAALYPVLLNSAGTALFSLGTTSGEGVTGKACRGKKDLTRFWVNRVSEDEERFSKEFYNDGALCGAILIGDLSPMADLKSRLGRKKEGSNA